MTHKRHLHKATHPMARELTHGPESGPEVEPESSMGSLRRSIGFGSPASAAPEGGIQGRQYANQAHHSPDLVKIDG